MTSQDFSLPQSNIFAFILKIYIPVNNVLLKIKDVDLINYDIEQDTKILKNI
jgi:hypothetical protein